MKSLELQQRARARIPGVSQLLSKRPEMFAPGQWPGYYSKAKGAHVWDLDGRKYLDMSIGGIGANALGYADEDVDAAVMEAVRNGNSCSLNCPEEVELADLLCDIHPWASMVRYARTGGESMAVAVRIARAHTGKDKIAFCGYHGWHDWYLAANLSGEEGLKEHLLPGLSPAGVPKGLAGTALPFRYNRIGELEAIVKAHGRELAAIALEPIRDNHPEEGFLEKVRAIADENGLVLIMDEISAAFRMNAGGSHLEFGVEPDIAVFSKALSNGYPMAAIIGREAVMQSAQKTFISSTYWTDRVGPAAALASIRKHRDRKVATHLMGIGRQVQEGWRSLAAKHGLAVKVHGIPPLSHIDFDYPDGKAVQTLFTQIMLEKGILAGGRFYSMYAHAERDVKEYLAGCDDAFAQMRRAKDEGAVEALLKGPVAHSGFQRLT